MCAVSIFTFAFCMTSCGSAQETDGRIKITVSIFPLWDWVRQIAAGADSIDIDLLVSDGTDMHSYQPSAADIVKITGSDMFFYVGGESDSWAAQALANDPQSKKKTLRAVDYLSGRLVEEETAEGMQIKGHSHEEHDESHEHEESEQDEHIWLSLKNAEVLAGAISFALGEIDPQNAGLYSRNAENYISELGELDAEYSAAAEGAKYKTLLFCGRFPFRYMIEDYGLDYYAAFPGCSSETDASFKTVVFLAGKVSELDLPAVCVTAGDDERLAKTVLGCVNDGGDIKILTFDSMQSVKLRSGTTDKTYLGAMRQNLEALKQALG